MTEPLAQYLKPRCASLSPLWFLTLAVIVVAGILAAGAHGAGVKAQQLAQSNEIHSRARAREMRPKPRPVALEDERRWAELKAEREFPWALVFDAVERADKPNIELLEFLPDKVNRRVLLRGEAQDRDAVTAYVTVLADQRSLTQVHVLHLQTLARDNLTTVGFEIKATIR